MFIGAMVGWISLLFISPHVMFRDASHVITNDQALMNNIRQYMDENKVTNTFYLFKGSIFDSNKEDDDIP